MKTSMFLPVLLLSNVVAAGNAEILKYAAVGSSFTFPPVNISPGYLYDLRTKDSQTLIATYHDSGNVRPSYNQRGNFSKNGTELKFKLGNLTKEDSKTYEQVVNMKVVAQIHLIVIEPVTKTTLRKVNITIDGSQCHVHLECSAQGADLLNVRFHKNGEEITGNITRMGNSSFLIIDPLDPWSPRTYTCEAWNPVGNETSPEILLPSTDNDKCKNATWNPRNSSVISIIIVVVLCIIIIIIITAFILYRKCQHTSGEKTNPSVRGDEESAEPTPETSPLIRKKTSEEQKSEDSSCIVPDPEEHGDMTMGNGQGGPTAENIQNSSDPGHCGQKDKSSVELKPLVSVPDGGQEAIG
ncbi:carcinoembryonic antigen-related cell adhesion molecule 21-like [Bufo gargarizans]|uniref:carcinoembryonic antigen-related cell adhesion molecule 21-like n=1 Tax=Bufo gargarizans TaxID=30331 RepID=UPI001CF38138|nr:carcinoembryonic antigen-related cell adhesion molecule 21-like [Bufo gargarizans]XP_044131348.1 carcinoembryonic antigen-related cell adhesion molecule 21-like [Bufo gargarizans]